MAAKNPRVAITLQQSTYDALFALSEASGMAMSAWAAAMIQQSEPVLWKMAEALREVRTNPNRAMELMEEAAQTSSISVAQQTIEIGETRNRLRKKRTVKKRRG